MIFAAALCQRAHIDKITNLLRIFYVRNELSAERAKSTFDICEFSIILHVWCGVIYIYIYVLVAVVFSFFFLFGYVWKYFEQHM